MINQLRAINLELNYNKESAPNKEEIILPQRRKSTYIVIFIISLKFIFENDL
jgi:hypothetical protein